MRIPQRRSQTLRIREDETENRFLTPEGIERLTATLERLKTSDRPRAVADVSEAVAKGDLSENAEYQEAKSRLARIDGRIFSLTERIKRAIPIETPSNGAGVVRLGSTVVVAHDGLEKTFQIVGPQETDPSRGRISHVSPLGKALIGRSVGETAEVDVAGKRIAYAIRRIGE